MTTIQKGFASIFLFLLLFAGGWWMNGLILQDGDRIEPHLVHLQGKYFVQTSEEGSFKPREYIKIRRSS